MEIFKLDSQLRRVAIFDQFESMIWTERFNEWGDFELELFYTPELRRLLPAGTFMSMSESYRVMEIETVEQIENDDGIELLKVSGRSIESVLENRANRVYKDPLFENKIVEEFVSPIAPLGFIKSRFNDICMYNEDFPEDNIPYTYPGSLFPPGSIPEPAAVPLEITLGNLYDTFKELGQAYKIGFRLYRDGDKSRLLFDAYTGNDRTTSQTVNNPVVFSKNLDNLKNTSRLYAIGNYKNIAYVYHPRMFRIVRLKDPFTTSGFSRSVLTVDASNVQLEPFTYDYTEGQKTALDELSRVGGLGQSDVFRRFIQKEWIPDRQRDLIEGMTESTSMYTPTQKARLAEVLVKYDAAVTAAIPLLRARLDIRGKEELAKYRRITAFDGEVNISSGYKYEIDYQLGDIVEFQNEDGVTEKMRVIEQIFVSDAEGERAYPTLEAEDQ